VVNPRLVPLSVGLLGAFVGVVAAVASQPVLGLVAGVLAAGAGRLAFAVREDVSALQRELAAQQTAATDLHDRLDDQTRQLALAHQLHEDLRAELATAQRAAEEASTPAPPADQHEVQVISDGEPTAAATDPAQLTDQDSQLFSEAYFRVALDARLASARRHLRPVAVALLDLYEGTAGSELSPATPSRAADSIRETVRDADTACRLADGTYAVILEDTPENGAVWTVERVRRNLVSRHGSHTMWAGVACYPAHAFSADELLGQAREALVAAREWNQDRIEVAAAE
jgi:two-component system cell cycle response regulator